MNEPQSSQSGTVTVRCPAPMDRLDRWLATWPSVGSRRRAREAVETGKVSIDGRQLAPNEHGQPVPAGATVAIAWTRPGTSQVAARAERRMADAGLRILLEDADVVIVDKPPGLLTDTAPGQTERDSVKKRLDERLRLRGQGAFVVHRIDGDTSGCVVLVKNEAAFKHVRAQFAEHTPERTYLAFVRGHLEGDEGVFEDWMRWDDDRMRQVQARPDGRQAVLASATWRTVERWPAASLLEVKLRTGRRNQIRLHLQLRDHPLYGERLYLPPTLKDQPAGFPRQALHAWRVAFTHPTTGARVSAESPLPPDLLSLKQKLARG